MMGYAKAMENTVKIIGAGLAGTQAALTLADAGCNVHLVEMRPVVQTAVHKGPLCAELVCSNSLKSTNPDSAAGMLKHELSCLNSHLYRLALDNRVAAGGALAVNREDFAAAATALVQSHSRITLERRLACSLAEEAEGCGALLLCTGPLTEGALADDLARAVGRDYLAFYDAAAPIVMADSIDYAKVFRQSRYEEGAGDYLNAPFDKEEYEAFIDELLSADRVVAKDFESRDLFQACQPIEEIARAGRDAPRFGPLKPVGLTDPRTGRRPWAALQLRAEDASCLSYNLVGFQTNLTFGEQDRVFRMIPGLENAEFARHGVMHRNTFIDAPRLLTASLECPVLTEQLSVPTFVAGQLCGTEGYVEAIRSGLHAAIGVQARLKGIHAPEVPGETAFGSLLAYATSEQTVGYQPSHVNFGVFMPLERAVRNKKERYAAYARRGREAMERYCGQLAACGLGSTANVAASDDAPGSEAFAHGR